MFLLISYAAGYIIPLLEIPILAKNLGPTQYGNVVFFYSSAFLCSLIVEYGFNLSASRQVAIAQGNKLSISRIFADVLLAKIFLFIFSIFIGAIFFIIFDRYISTLNYKMIFWAAIFFLACGFNPFWYFQGRERMAGVIVFDLCLRGIGLAMQFLFVKNEHDATLALAIISSVGLATTLFSMIWCLQEIGIAPMSLNGAMRQITQGFNVFIYRSSNNILLSAAPTVLGATAGQAALASFVPAEKVIRGVTGFVTPILTALFPHNARKLAGRRNVQALRETWIVICIIALVGTCVSVILWFFGPRMLNIVLGEQYAASEKLLKLFAWIIPFRMANQALGIILIIPTQKDRIAGILLSCFSIIALVLGGKLSSFFGSLGMVVAFLVSEVMLFISLLTISLKISISKSYLKYSSKR